MAILIEPLRQEKKLVDYLDELCGRSDVRKEVAILFWHGLGDCIQFRGLLEHLRHRYAPVHKVPSLNHVSIDILLQSGLGQKVVFEDGIELTDASDEYLASLDYDYIFKVHFPVEVPGKTKSELCCETELGIDPITIYSPLPGVTSKLVGIHLFNTALPGIFNIDEETARKVWNMVIDEGFVPIELAFPHIYHNPKNVKFDFIDCSVRSVKATVDSLLSILGLCVGFIGVPSGPLHCAIAMEKPILYLERGVGVDRFIRRDSIVSLKVDDLNEEDVRKWLKSLPVAKRYLPWEEMGSHSVTVPDSVYTNVGSTFGV